MLTRRSLMGSATALALLMGIAAPALAGPDEALAKLQETVLSKGPSGEDPSPASSVVLSDEELAKMAAFDPSTVQRGQQQMNRRTEEFFKQFQQTNS